ncbi:MAG: DUF971 domain-containing protein [Acidobacteriota bacterium]
MYDNSVPQRLPVEINAAKSSPVVEIVWDDGHRSQYSVNTLRQICPCATCREGSGQTTHQAAKSANVPKPRLSLPIFKEEKYKLADMHYVGSYALGITWQDRHQSIYPWVLLSEECPCRECTIRRQTAVQDQDR